MDNINTTDLIAAQLQQAARVADPFERLHIFHTILAYCNKQESASARMDMMYRFTQCQKCLASMRDGNVARAERLIAEIDAAPLVLHSDAARAGMEALYCAVVAYKHYAVRDYATAVDCLERSRRCFEALRADGFERALLAMADLHLNLVRVYVAAGQTGKAVDTAVDVLQFLFSGHGRFAAPTDLAALYSPAELSSIRNFFTDALISKLLSTNDHAQIDAFFQQLSATTARWTPGALRTAFETYFRMTGDLAADGLDREFLSAVSIPALPVSLQYFIVSGHLKHRREAADPTTSAVIGAYFDGLPEVKRLRTYSWCQ